MTTHAGIAMIGASATFVTIVECLRAAPRCRRVVFAGMAFTCFVVLAAMPCWTHPAVAHKIDPPALENRPDLGQSEKLLLAHYRRIRLERELPNAVKP